MKIQKNNKISEKLVRINHNEPRTSFQEFAKIRRKI